MLVYVLHGTPNSADVNSSIWPNEVLSAHGNTFHSVKLNVVLFVNTARSAPCLSVSQIPLEFAQLVYM
jgi:hypothetical protein